MEIKRTFKESMPDTTFIGKRYLTADRDEHGTFAGKWEDWFKNRLFDKLLENREIEFVRTDYIGMMRENSALEGGFEYCIGLFAKRTAVVPEGFCAIDIDACDIAVSYVYGKENTGELYSEEACSAAMKAWSDAGYSLKNGSWFFERYNCPRFTQPDEKGNVILDICAYID